MDLRTAPAWCVELFVEYMRAMPAAIFVDVNKDKLIQNHTTFNPLFNLFCEIRGFCS